MRYILLVFCLLLPLIVKANCIAGGGLLKEDVKANAPQQYVVKANDTLWSIASVYLHSPWKWQALWHANPSIKNPDHLYVGAVLELHHSHRTTPFLNMVSNGVVKLSPSVKVGKNPAVVPAIALKDIEPFLNRSFVLDLDALNESPYVVAFADEHLMAGQGDQIYVNKLPTPPALPEGTTISYSIFRPNKIYFDPNTKERLGFLATFIGNGELVSPSPPAILLLTNITEGVKIKDRVVVNNQPDFDPSFEPSTPLSCVTGHIIDLPGHFMQGAVGLVATIDKGANAGLRPGDVLGINARPRLIKDPENPDKRIKLPARRIGELMIFRVFAQTSFGLVVRSIRPIYILDGVTNP